MDWEGFGEAAGVGVDGVGEGEGVGVDGVEVVGCGEFFSGTEGGRGGGCEGCEGEEGGEGPVEGIHLGYVVWWEIGFLFCFWSFALEGLFSFDLVCGS